MGLSVLGRREMESNRRRGIYPPPTPLWEHGGNWGADEVTLSGFGHLLVSFNAGGGVDNNLEAVNLLVEIPFHLLGPYFHVPLLIQRRHTEITPLSGPIYTDNHFLGKNVSSSVSSSF